MLAAKHIRLSAYLLMTCVLSVVVVSCGEEPSATTQFSHAALGISTEAAGLEWVVLDPEQILGLEAALPEDSRAFVEAGVVLVSVRAAALPLPGIEVLRGLRGDARVVVALSNHAQQFSDLVAPGSGRVVGQTLSPKVEDTTWTCIKQCASAPNPEECIARCNDKPEDGGG
jgi:hypothetical protein